MLARLLIIAVALGASSKRRGDPAEDSYQSARAAYRALKGDPVRRKFRHHWLNVAHRFDQVFQNHSKSRRAPDALLAEAELYEELSHISRINEDLQAAVADYRRLMDVFPKTAPGDRAALALAKIQLERKGDPSSARRTLEKQVKLHPNGDAAIKVMLASLPKSKSPDGPAKRVSHLSRSPTSADSAASGDPAEAAILRKSTGEELRSADGEKPSEGDKASDLDSSAEGAAGVRDRLRAAPSRRAGVTLAEQLGLKIRRVVIDPGHGGHDTGAIGRLGTREKDVALKIAKRLATLLTSSGLEAVLTRDGDEFVPLDERARLANGAKGDLFISIHCNSAKNRKLRGIETYTLNTSADRYSIRLAARENSASEKGISDLQFILADLATKANTEESLRLASRLQQKLVSRLSTKYRGIENLGTKEALFYVLLGVRMPAVLVETSFLSQPEEERRLASKQYQEDVARAMAAGIHDFLDDRQRVAAKVQ